MIWREDIHPSWRAPTTIMDATMSPPIVQQFFPTMPDPEPISVEAPHTFVRQIIDRAMSANMLTRRKTKGKAEQTRANHVLEIRRFVEVRANGMQPGRVLVICQKELRAILDDGTLPANVDLGHFNAIEGVNLWKDVSLLMLIGRTEPPPWEVEKLARTLFDADITELPEGQWYPKVERGVQMRDGRIFPMECPAHPDPRAEAVRAQICEAKLVQAIGRGRAVTRTVENALQIDILTNYALPIVVDELTTWSLIQPTLAEIMRCRGAAPVNYRDMAAAYPDLFTSAHAAQMALIREIGLDINGLTQIPITISYRVISNRRL